MLCAQCRRRLDTDTPRCPACAGDPLLDGRYRLDRELVEHPRATSFRATRIDDALLVRICAVQPKPTEFDAHAHAASRSLALDHRSLARLLACVRSPTTLWLIQEQIPGQTLAAALELTPERWREPVALLELMAGLADGLVALHEHGLAHADISTASILVASDTRPTVLIDVHFDPSVSLADDVLALGLVFAATASGLASMTPTTNWRDRVGDDAVVALIDRMLTPEPEQRITSATLCNAVAGLLRVRQPDDDRRSPPTLPRARRATPRFMMIEPPTPAPRAGSASQVESRRSAVKSREPGEDIPVMRPEDLSRELSQAHRATAAYEQRKHKHDVTTRALVVVVVAVIVALSAYIVLHTSGWL